MSTRSQQGPFNDPAANAALNRLQSAIKRARKEQPSAFARAAARAAYRAQALNRIALQEAEAKAERLREEAEARARQQRVSAALNPLVVYAKDNGKPAARAPGSTGIDYRKIYDRQNGRKEARS